MKKVNSNADFFTDEKSGEKIYNVSKSRLVSLIDVVSVVKRYFPIARYILATLIFGDIIYILYKNGFDFPHVLTNEVFNISLEKLVVFDLGWKSMLLCFIVLWLLNRRENAVYLLDFTTFEPPQSWKLTAEELLDVMRAQKCFTDESIAFQEKLMKQSGVGPSTAWPPGITRCRENGLKSDRSAAAARAESEVVIYDVVERVLKETNTKPKDVDILVINCSLFSPTPSLCSMVVNKFGMRSDIASYNLAGMGCSAGLISIELVKSLLNSRPNSVALVVSTENLTQNLYHGNERGFLVQNTLFRCGGAAIVLSNRWYDAFRARFKLLYCVRTQYVSEDSFGCVLECEDTNNERGVRLSKDIVKVAGRAMEKNFTTLGPYVLPLSEQAKTGWSMLKGFLVKKANATFGMNIDRVTPYIPDFKRGVDHFCIHAGGRGVIDGIEKNLNLTPDLTKASRYALYTYGNTSSSSIWYEMDYIKNFSNLKRGQRVLQVAFGSGFKCNSGVWLCINSKPSNKPKRDIQDFERQHSKKEN